MEHQAAAATLAASYLPALAGLLKLGCASASSPGWLLVVQLYLFGWRVQQQPRLGLAAALVLATTPAYVGFHVVRTGDADALLVLFVTAYLLSFWTFLQRQQRCFLAGASVGLALALLAKCSAAALPLPGLLAYVLLVPRHRWVSRNKLVTGAFLLAFGPLLLYYGLREAAASGYLVAAWHNDWFKLPVTPLC